MLAATSKSFLTFSRSVVSKANRLSTAAPLASSLLRAPQRPFSQDNFLNGANANYVD